MHIWDVAEQIYIIDRELGRIQKELSLESMPI